MGCARGSQVIFPPLISSPLPLAPVAAAKTQRTPKMTLFIMASRPQGGFTMHSTVQATRKGVYSLAIPANKRKPTKRILHPVYRLLPKMQ